MTNGKGAALRSTTSVAVAMGVMNVATYGFQVLAANLLGPQPYGALAALMNLLLVVMVLSLALQANAARRIAAAPEDVRAVERDIRRVGRQAALALAVVTLLSAPLVNSLLHLDSLLTAVTLGLCAVPLTIMGYQLGVLQGERRWMALGLVYLALGLGRLLIGTGLVLANPTPLAGMTGVAIAAWAPVAIGAWVLRPRSEAPTSERTHTGRELWRETLRNAHALLAFFALSNVDVLIARNVMHPHEAGLYAGGLILTKAVLFLPQFVVVLAFPSMGAAGRRRQTLLAGLGAVSLIGVVVAIGVSVLSGLAMVFVGGQKYHQIEPWLWAFALLGALLAMLQILVYGVLARESSRSVYLVWLALVVVAVVARTADTFSELLLVVTAVDAGLLVVLFGISLWRLGDDSALVGGVVPAVPGADRDVEGDGQLGG